jgi:hypothetical protein
MMLEVPAAAISIATTITLWPLASQKLARTA